MVFEFEGSYVFACENSKRVIFKKKFKCCIPLNMKIAFLELSMDNKNGKLFLRSWVRIFFHSSLAEDNMNAMEEKKCRLR